MRTAYHCSLTLVLTFRKRSYNNMNMCFDYNKFTPKVALIDETFVITEQIPGHIVTNDLSAKLQKDRYFGSFK